MKSSGSCEFNSETKMVHPHVNVQDFTRVAGHSNHRNLESRMTPPTFSKLGAKIALQFKGLIQITMQLCEFEMKLLDTAVSGTSQSEVSKVSTSAFRLRQSRGACCNLVSELKLRQLLSLKEKATSVRGVAARERAVERFDRSCVVLLSEIFVSEQKAINRVPMFLFVHNQVRTTSMTVELRLSEHFLAG
ncbi:hypothetical protein T11_15801 [Trichinella zimbabwensis]|uniref:Uncharacterized protein n=1 Tax=Trichinella zimbabwensis TaxID=268475 RepID=A0A0V1HWE4_9BILA|nr:hypothetical protein T11_15801 [Trichinella zimbabwensis]